MKKILIIGSKGFIGSHAYQYFLNNGYHCIGCDVVVDYVDKNYLLLDSNNSDFNSIFENNDVDFCLNCSGAASVADSMTHTLRDFTLNTFNVLRILEALKKYRPACKFINLSSAAVYGNPTELPVHESAPTGPISPYGIHKLHAEEICKEYNHFFGIQTCSLRIFSAYGPGLKKKILWDIYQKAISGASVLMFGTGAETRDFIYVSDIVRVVELVMQNGDFNADVYNVANGSEISINYLAKEMLRELSYKGELVFSGTTRVGDPLNWKAGINKLQAIGYTPTVDIDSGIKKYVKWLAEEKLD